MYQQHFGLKRAPFKITPDTSLFYEGNKRGAALEALVYAIKSGEGIVKVVGEVGSGKTMLCRMLELRLSGVVDVVYIANPSLSPDNILHVIAHELGLAVNNDNNKHEVMQKLQQYLLDKHANNRQVVLFVEEAQSMPVETLEEIRLLSNLETERHKLLQMVLFGQPELDTKLAQSEIRQLKERITHSFFLDPFPPDDTREYLNFRLRSVGYRGPDVFNQKTANTVEKYSSGLTRRINVLADKALMASFSEGGHSVTSKHVKTAALDSNFKILQRKRPWYLGIVVVLALGLAVWAGALIPQQGIRVELPLTEVETPPNSKAAENAATQKLPGPETAESVGDVALDAPRVAAIIEPEPQKEPVPRQNNAANLLQQRLASTQSWLNQVAPRDYSIQLLLARFEKAYAVEEFLQNIPEALDLDKIYIYVTVIDSERKYSVLYNNYASLREAQSKLDSLPETLRVSQPFLRRINTIVAHAPDESG